MLKFIEVNNGHKSCFLCHFGFPSNLHIFVAKVSWPPYKSTRFYFLFPFPQTRQRNTSIQPALNHKLSSEIWSRYTDATRCRQQRDLHTFPNASGAFDARVPFSNSNFAAQNKCFNLNLIFMDLRSSNCHSSVMRLGCTTLYLQLRFWKTFQIGS